jgi:hypothetical protein
MTKRKKVVMKTPFLNIDTPEGAVEIFSDGTVLDGRKKPPLTIREGGPGSGDKGHADVPGKQGDSDRSSS